MESTKLILYIFFIFFADKGHGHTASIHDEDKSLISVFDTKLETTLLKIVDYLTEYLEGFNDNYLGRSEVGKLLQYEELKPKITEITKKGRMMKKSSMAMMPLMFQIGATSTWMLLTTVLAAKSVAIGLILLVFKIAISSAKVSSFFTNLKHQGHGWNSVPQHHDVWAPHYETI